MAIVAPPVLVQPVPDINLNVGSDLNIDLGEYVHNLHENCGEMRFVVTLEDGAPLPEGLSCSPSGQIAGRVSKLALREAPYHLLIIAKNKADVPLITYSDLMIHDGAAIRDGETAIEEDIFGEHLEASSVPPDDELVEAFQASLGVDMEAITGDWEGKVRLSDEEHKRLFVEHWLRKFASLQFYNAEFDGEITRDPLKVETAGTGWSIYTDGEFAVSTSNPEPFAGFLNRSKLIDTAFEMVEKVVQMGWRVVGVAGIDKHVGLRSIHIHNLREQRKPEEGRRTLAFDEIFQDPQWVQDVIHNFTPQLGGEVS